MNSCWIIPSSMKSRPNTLWLRLWQIESLESILQVHQTIVTMEQISSGPDTPRHQAQKKQLPLTLKKEHGKWGPSHTRHRLLDALHGFLKYSERQAAELARLKGLYKHVSKSQRKVWINSSNTILASNGAPFFYQCQYLGILLISKMYKNASDNVIMSLTVHTRC